MRIQWYSNAPWSSVGYGVQTRLFAPRINRLGYPVSIFAFYGLEGAMLNWQDGIPVYPRAFHPYGADITAAHAAHFDADIILSLMDAWVNQPEQMQGRRWVPWFPIDMEPAPPPVLRNVQRAFHRIAMSQFGMRMLENAGLSCSYVPHGVETDTFKPKPAEAIEWRKAAKVDPDTFLVGMVAANKGNPSRKAFPEQLEGFAQFHRRHPDSVLYLHTLMGQEQGGVNLPEVCDQFGIRDSVRFCDQYLNLIGFNDGYMSTAYSAMDVLLSVTMGEGFGIPIIEAQACGTPVIVGDWTAMPELCFSGWKVSRDEAHKWYTPLGSYQYLPSAGAIADRLDAAYNARTNQNYADWARTGAMDYDADRITEVYWRPLLEQIAAEITAETQRKTPVPMEVGR